MPKIIEAIVITQNKIGENHIVPLGLISDNDYWVIAPYRPSQTIDNLIENPYAVVNLTDDVRVFAGCVTGRRDWDMVPADVVPSKRLKNTTVHWELKVEKVTDDNTRPLFHCARLHVTSHQVWGGYNRAQAALLELAVLTTRLHLLPVEKIEAEIEYLQTAITKTAGPYEVEAWGWLNERIEEWRVSHK